MTRILVVEDFAPLRILVQRVLSAEGHDVASAATAPEAYEASGSHDVDLLVTDMQVPGGTGTEIARRLALEHPGLRVLFTSGIAEHDLELDLPGTLTAFLQKPFDIDDLVDAVRILARRDVTN